MYVIESLAPVVEPGSVVLGQQRAVGYELGLQGGAPRPLPVSQGDGGLRFMYGSEAMLDVNPRVPRKGQP